MDVVTKLRLNKQGEYMIEIDVTEVIDGIELDKNGRVVLKFSSQEDLDGFKEAIGETYNTQG